MLVSELNNNQSRALAWMREAVYEWWLIHTDHSSNTRPKNGPMGVMFEFIKTNFGNNINEQCPQGPPSK